MTRQQIVFTIMLFISSRAYAMPQDIVIPGETTLPSPTTTTRTTTTTEAVTQPSIVWTTVALPSNYFECLHNCQTISSYVPVCGTDGVVYTNIYKLNCANRCGNNVRVFKEGQCRFRRRQQ
ncbi:uncharacterized protein LOC100679565 [Nasonia vitripennis]|uniref:Kazal-like domain-containing protein n=1 Tax=Nasonia vitripennis TaxID=7425 RepID=A0A7M7H6N1_NASVI|nr:uncharacterized protein LOC100679565 [Nasonia vitripennis]